MPAPRGLARFNRRFTNKLLTKVAGRLPGFGIVTHAGRKSGRTYHTHMNVFSRDGEYVLALTYGPKSDRVKNVLAAGACEIRTRGESVRLRAPRLATDRKKSWAPLPVGLVLGLIRAPTYLRLAPEADPREDLR